MGYQRYDHFLISLTWTEKTLKTVDLNKGDITYVYADEECIITGNSKGVLVLRNPASGDKLCNLNVSREHKKLQITNVQSSAEQLPLSPLDRVNWIERHGKWVFSCQEVRSTKPKYL
jgi:hypothetical protein